MTRIELVDVSSCRKNLIVEIPAGAAQEDYERVSREFARHARVPGFRPGKAPLKIIRQRYEEQIRKQMVEDLVPRYYQQAIREKELKPISEPLLEKVDFQQDGALKFEASFEILPPIQVEGYRDLRITVQRREVTPEDEEKALASIRERHSRVLPVSDRPSRSGDLVAVDLKGRLQDGSGVEFEDRNVVVALGDERTVAGFSEQLTGVQPGEQHEFTIPYEEDFSNPRLAGKEVHYQVEVVAVRERQLPELDDELAREAGNYTSLQELREAVSRDLRKAADEEFEAGVRDELLQQLTARNAFEVPDSLVDKELRNIFQRIADKMLEQGIDVQRASIDWKKIAQENRPRALERARRNLALTAVAEQEAIPLPEEELDQEIARLAELANKTPEAARASLAKEDQLEQLRQQLRRRKALEWIREHGVVA